MAGAEQQLRGGQTQIEPVSRSACTPRRPPCTSPIAIWSKAAVSAARRWATGVLPTLAATIGALGFPPRL
jgi:hypothetical protein